MPVSGLVVSLVELLPLREKTIEVIRQESRIEVGVIESQRMSVVVDTTSSDDDKKVWQWLTNLPGVVFVDVVMVGFEENEDVQTEDGQAADSKRQCVDINTSTRTTN